MQSLCYLVRHRTFLTTISIYRFQVKCFYPLSIRSSYERRFVRTELIFFLKVLFQKNSCDKIRENTSAVVACGYLLYIRVNNESHAIAYILCVRTKGVEYLPFESIEMPSQKIFNYNFYTRLVTYVIQISKHQKQLMLVHTFSHHNELKL